MDLGHPFREVLRGDRNRGGAADEALLQQVTLIVQDVAVRGDEALFAYTRSFDGYELTPGTVAVTQPELEGAAGCVVEKDREMLKLAARRIEAFPRHQIRGIGWTPPKTAFVWDSGSCPGTGGDLCAGGLAAYPSTVLLAAIPARLAGVEETSSFRPSGTGHTPFPWWPQRLISRRVPYLQSRGAQAVAALAYGTASLPRVVKIVGPGNAYVAAAKKTVFGQVDIDMIAGPSEILVIADGTTPAAFVAADLLAQAEHDALASAVLLTPNAAYADAVSAEAGRQLARLRREAIARSSLTRYGAAVVTVDLKEAAALAHRFAPEHLELAVENPEALLPLIRNAGAVFMGPYTPETLGDYLAGPNHILPTAGTARFSSALGVYDFVKRISVLSFSSSAFQTYGPPAKQFADLEGLEGHGQAIRVRLESSRRL